MLNGIGCERLSAHSRQDTSSRLRPPYHQVSSSATSRRRQLPTRQRQALVCRAAAQRSYYEVLEVAQDADIRTIKSAYRKKALKLHPDVNKAPDAQQRFVEAKAAFETLSDAAKRADYDRQLRGGFPGFGDWGRASSGYGASSSGYGRTKKQQQEDNYNLGSVFEGVTDSLLGVAETLGRGANDLWRDLGKEVDDWKRERRGGKSKEDSKDQLPKSLWEELDEIGEDMYGLADELVGYIEQTLGIDDGAEAQRKKDGRKPGDSTGTGSGDSGTSSTGTSSERDRGRSRSASSSASGQGTRPPSSPRPPPPPKKTVDEEVDEMLKELKRKVAKKQ